MLYLIKGRAGSGKTEYLRNIIDRDITASKNNPLLIVPKQFSFESERIMLKKLGAEKLRKLSVCSFSWLAHSVLKNTAEMQKKMPDTGVRTALMSEALLQLEGNLKIFSGYKFTATSLYPLVEFSKNLKFAQISSEELSEKIEMFPEGLLKDKLSELNLISQAYDALIKQSYFDDTEILDLLCEYASKHKIFEGRTIYLDGFRDFSKQEFELLSLMISQADNVYVTLCMGEFPGKYTSFYFIKKLENKIRTIASRSGCSVDEIFFNQSKNAFASDIFSLEKNIYSEKTVEKSVSDGSVRIVRCVDKFSECKYVASSIKKLLRSGEYRCKDIAVIERTNGTYKSTLIDELKRIDVPVYDDSTRPVVYETLFVYMNALLLCITGGLTSENIFTYLKTGLTSLNVNDVSCLEKYALVWGIGSKQWSEGFTMHPDGFGRPLDDYAQKRLDRLNELRKSVIAPLLKLKKECKDTTGKDICKKIYEFLTEQKISDKLYLFSEKLETEGFPVEANRQAVCWDNLINILEQMAIMGEEKYISLSRWSELFSILVSSCEIGEIPQGLDEITIGSADRIRTEKKKVVFLVGVNKDEFPLVSVKNDILTDSDRVFLAEMGLDISPSFRDSVDEERFISYCAVTAASEKLYLTYKTVDSDGGELFPSEIVDLAKKCIDNVSIIEYDKLDAIELAESEDALFSVFSENFGADTTEQATLTEYFSSQDEYRDKINSIKRVLGDKKYKYNDPKVSLSLFKENMRLSASRVESYYKCPFAYFVRYGLNAEPLRTAELDPAQSGNVVHFVMEKLLKEYPKGRFIDAENSELRGFVESTLNSYIEEMMGGAENKTNRFIFLFNRLIETCMAIIERLKEEFSVGSFEPCGFEVAIGGDDISEYTVALENGTASVRGFIDRVDIMEKDGIKYIRIIDYKTGKKEFELSEIYDGLNIQMLLYLMALEKNGKDVYGEFIPSGVLYLPSRIGFSNYLNDRNPKTEEIMKRKKISGKLSGMILQSLVVLNGMGAMENPGYFPAGYDSAKDRFTGNTYTQSNFKSISKIIDQKIKLMGDALHKGEINAIPCGKNGEGAMCKYCAYKCICGYEYGDEIHQITNLNHKAAIEKLGGESDEQ